MGGGGSYSPPAPPLPGYAIASPTFRVLKASAQVTKGGGHAAILHIVYANYTIFATQRGDHGPMPPLNTPLIATFFWFCKEELLNSRMP